MHYYCCIRQLQAQVFQHDTACLRATLELRKDHSVPVLLASRTFCGRHGSHAIEIVLLPNTSLGGLPPFEKLVGRWDSSQVELMGLDFSLFGLRLFCAKSALFSLVNKSKQSAVSCKKSGRNIAYCAVQKTIKTTRWQSRGSALSYRPTDNDCDLQLFKTCTKTHPPPCSSFGSQAENTI